MQHYSTYDDGRLVSLLAQGDELAFTELFDRYWERMVYRAFDKLGSRPDAEEAVQEVFFELWKRREHIRPVERFDLYLAAAVKYKVLRHLAQRHRRAAVEAGVTTAPNTEETALYLEFHELKKQIESTVRALPEKCRLVYRLSREQGLSTAEIADTLNISPKTAEAHLTKALKTLRGSVGLFVIFL